MKSYFKWLAMLAISSMVAVVPANADSTNVASMLVNVGKSAMTGYCSPLVTTLGSGMNAGWYNSAKPLSMFGKLPFGISIGMMNVSVVAVDNSMKNFDFSGQLPTGPVLGGMNIPGGYSLDGIIDSLNTLPSSVKSAIESRTGYSLSGIGIDTMIMFMAKNQPTIFGSDSAQKTTLENFLTPNPDSLSRTMKTIKAYNALRKYQDSMTTVLGGGSYNRSMSANDTIDLSQPLPLPFRGLGKIIDELGGMMFSLPTVQVEFGLSKLPVIDNLTIGIRYLPEIDLKSMSNDMPFSSVGLFGFKVQYEYLHLLPFASKLPFKSSVLFAESGFHIGKPSDSVYLNQSNWLVGLNASWDVRWAAFGAGVFTGIDYESSNLGIDVTLPAFNNITFDKFHVDIPGQNHFRFTIGPRLNIGPIEIFGAANFGSITSYSVGVTAIALNGRGL